MSSALFKKLYPQATVTSDPLGTGSSAEITSSSTLTGPGSMTLPVDTTAAPVTLTLAGFAAGDRIEIIDRSNTDVGAALPNPLTLDPGASALIEGLGQAALAADPLTEGFAAFALEFDGSNFEIVAR